MKSIEEKITQCQLETEDIVIQTAATLKKRYKSTMREVIDIIALWWLHNDIKSLTDAQSNMPSLMSELDGVIDPANEEYVEQMTELFAEVYAFNYEFAQDVLEVQEKESHDDILLAFVALGLASNPWADDGLTYSQRMTARSTQLKNNIKQIVLRGATLGYSTKKIMAMVEKEMSKSKYRGLQIMVDESNHYANEAFKEVGESNFTGYQISGILDMKQCEHCRSMHGKQYKWDEFEIGLTAPMFHHSCRCRIIPIGKQPNLYKL